MCADCWPHCSPCLPNLQYVPERRAPTREEVARHNAVAPLNLQLVCRDLNNTGFHIKRRVCRLRQDMHLLRNHRDRIWVANIP